MSTLDPAFSAGEVCKHKKKLNKKNKNTFHGGDWHGGGGSLIIIYF